jgi:hypothetical protein
MPWGSVLRLFFFEKSLGGSETVEESPIAAISSMSMHTKMTGETLLVHAAGAKAEIKSMPHGQGDALIRGFWRVKQGPDGSDVTPAAAWCPPSISQRPPREIDQVRVVDLAQCHDGGRPVMRARCPSSPVRGCTRPRPGWAGW